MSKVFSSSALKALTRIGDILLPKNGEFPSFSESGCLEHVDDVASYAPADDLKDLNLLLSILSFMPDFLLRWVVKSMNNSHGKDGLMLDLLRMLDLGLKGILFGTYYSGKVGKNFKGKSPFEVIDFKVTRIEVEELSAVTL